MTRRRIAALATAAILLAGCTSLTTSPAAGTSGTSSSPPRPTLAGNPLSAAPGPSSDDPPQTVPAPAGTALAALRALPVKGRAPKTGYSRGQFGRSWTDDVTTDGGHNGCDTRNDVLRRDLAAVIIKMRTQGCVAASGTLHDPYTGRDIMFVRGAQTSVFVQIDHLVALSNAWQTGAQGLDAEQRQNLANDPLELLAVDGPTNEIKGDGDAATWLPAVKTFRCAYVSRQIAVKARYGLWVTAAEEAAMESVLGACPAQPLPTTASTRVPPVLQTSGG